MQNYNPIHFDKRIINYKMYSAHKHQNKDMFYSKWISLNQNSILTCYTALLCLPGHRIGNMAIFNFHENISGYIGKWYVFLTNFLHKVFNGCRWTCSHWNFDCTDLFSVIILYLGYQDQTVLFFMWFMLLSRAHAMYICNKL